MNVIKHAKRSIFENITGATDFNTLIDNGVFRIDGSTATNPPVAGAFYWIVEVTEITEDSSVYQESYKAEDAVIIKYIRQGYETTSGIDTWTDWSVREPDLGNPSSDGQILSSTIAGARSWIDAPSGLTGITDSETPFTTQLGENGPVSITGEYNTLSGYGTGISITSGHNNFLFGHDAGTNITTGHSNIAMGQNALRGDPTSKLTRWHNIGIGYNAGYDLTDGTYNTFLGVSTGSSITVGDYNIFVGYNAGLGSVTGNSNIGIGEYALADTLLTGNDNIGIGFHAGYNLTSSSGSILLGSNAGSNLTSGNSNIGIGTGALTGSVGSTLSEIVAIGTNAGSNLDTGSGNSIYLAVNAGYYVTEGNINIAVGAGSLQSNVTNPLTGDYNIHIGYDGAAIETTSTNNLWLGAGPLTAGVFADTLRISNPTTKADVALIEGDFSAETVKINGTLEATGGFIGIVSLTGVTDGASPWLTQLGESQPVALTGTYCTIIGYNAGVNITSGGNNIALGHSALMGDVTTKLTGSYNIGIGEDTGYGLTTGHDNIFMGVNAGYTADSGSDNFFAGQYSGYLNDGSDNVAIGFYALYGSGAAQSSRNIAIGESAGRYCEQGGENIYMGYSAAMNATQAGYGIVLGSQACLNLLDGSHTIAIGRFALRGDITAKLTGDYNIGIGPDTGNYLSTGQYNLLLGNSAGYHMSSGSNNTAVGYQALYSDLTNKLTGGYNVAVGNGAGKDVTSGVSNSFLGNRAGSNVTSGSSNTGIGLDGLKGNSAGLTGSNNIGIGIETGQYLTSGDYNTLIGWRTGFYLHTSSYNIGVGYQALFGTNGVYFTGDHNIHLGSFGGAIQTTSNNNLWLGAGPITGGVFNDTLRIASPSATSDTALIEGDFSGNTVTVNGDLTATSFTGDGSGLTGLSGIGEFIGSSIAISNAGTALFSDDGSDNQNIGIGDYAGYAITTGIDNICLGDFAGRYLVTATDCVLMGESAGRNLTGIRNIAIGKSVLYAASASTGIYNIALGYEAGKVISTGYNNVFLGRKTGVESTTTHDTIAMGAYAAEFLTTAINSIAIGESALNGHITSKLTGTSNIGIGKATGYNLSTGTYNIMLGSTAGQNIGTGDYNTALGSNSLRGLTTTYLSGDNNIGIGSYSGNELTTGYSNNLQGLYAGRYLTVGYRNVAIGEQALQGDATSKFTGNYNIGIGFNVGSLITTGSNNVFQGYSAGQNITAGGYNVGVGFNALRGNAIGFTGGDNIGIGGSTGLNLTTGARNIIMGAQSGYYISSGDTTVLIGYQAGQNVTTSDSNIGIGDQALFGDATGITGANNIGIGTASGYSLSTGHNNNLIGFNSGKNITTGTYNIAMSVNALAGDATSKLTGHYNIGFGYSVGSGLTSGSENILLGRNTAFDITTGSSNVLLGYFAGNHITTSTRNIAMGYQSLFGDATLKLTGNDNIGIGYRTGYKLTTGYKNTFIGSSAGINTVGNTNIALGADSLMGAAASTFTNAIGIGRNTGLAYASGNGNIFIGDAAGTSKVSGNNCLIIGTGAQASTTTIANEITLGDSLIATLRCQQTSITALSDERDKTNINDLGAGIEFINSLRPVTYQWDKRDWYDDGINDGSKIDDIIQNGFIAQEVKSSIIAHAGGELEDLILNNNPDRLEFKQGDLIPVMVTAIQELSTQVGELKAEMQTLLDAHNSTT